MLIHLHIPKTGGTSVRHLLAANYGSGFYGFLPVVRADSFWTVNQKEQSKFTCLSGHLAYGMTSSFSWPVEYLVTLRDPVERLLSLYHYRWIKDAARRTEEERLQTLEDFLSSTEWACNDNDQTRHLAGMACHGSNLRQGSRSVDSKDLDLAIENLQNCKWIGITEHLQQDINRIADQLGWRVRELGHSLSQPVRTHAADLSPALRRQIEDSQCYDYELYRQALVLRNRSCAK